MTVSVDAPDMTRRGSRTQCRPLLAQVNEWFRHPMSIHKYVFMGKHWILLCFAHSANWLAAWRIERAVYRPLRRVTISPGGALKLSEGSINWTGVISRNIPRNHEQYRTTDPYTQRCQRGAAIYTPATGALETHPPRCQPFDPIYTPVYFRNFTDSMSFKNGNTLNKIPIMQNSMKPRNNSETSLKMPWKERRSSWRRSSIDSDRTIWRTGTTGTFCQRRGWIVQTCANQEILKNAQKQKEISKG